MESAEWYRKEIAKLYTIIASDNANPVHASYLMEKMKRILLEVGIGAHPALNEVIDRVHKENYFNVTPKEIVKLFKDKREEMDTMPWYRWNEDDFNDNDEYI